MIEARSLSYSYRDGFRLQSLSFAVAPGSFLGIIGPNGSGKSTLLRLLLKMIRPPEVSLFVDGNDVHHLPQAELARLVAFVPQLTVPDQAFTVRQIVMMGRYPHRRGLFSSDDADSEVDRALVRMDLGSLADRPVTRISGGEFQRVLTARALAQAAPVIVLDEPTNHLDLKNQLLLLRLLRGEQQENGVTIIAVFHNINLALQHCDRLLVLDAGRQEAYTEPESLIASSTLETVYGIEFERVPRADGQGTLLAGKLPE